MYTSVSHAQAWQATNKWDTNTEADYMRWVHKQATADIFLDKDKAFGGRIGVDCAKAVYALRALYAYKHHLPFKVIGNSGEWIDAQSGTYSEQDPDRRFINFAARLASNTSVETLKFNTFPVALTMENIVPGTLFIFQLPGQGGDKTGRHTYMVRGIQPSGMLEFQWSTVPAAPRRMTQHVDLPYYMPINVSILNQWGFRRFYQPDDYNIVQPAKAVLANPRASAQDKADAEQKLIALLGPRGYNSTDQNNVAQAVLDHLKATVQRTGSNPTPPVRIDDFLGDADNTPLQYSAINFYQQSIVDRLAKGSPETMNALLKRHFFNLCSFAKERQSFVEEGYDYFFRKAHIVNGSASFNRCPTNVEIYDFATPSRDSQFLEFVKNTKAWYLENKEHIKAVSPKWYKMYEVIYNNGEDFGVGPTTEKSEAIDLVLNEKINDEGDLCAIPIDRHTRDANSQMNLNIWEIVDKLPQKDLMSAEPWVSVDRRWGLERATPEQREHELNISHCQKASE